MKHHLYHWIIIGLCISLAACHNEEDALPSSNTLFSLGTTIDSYTSGARSMDESTGYEGIIKRKFVSQDEITVYTDQNTEGEKVYKATLQEDGKTWNWEAGNPLLLPLGADGKNITATYTADGQPDELVAYECQLQNDNITLHFTHRKAMLSVVLWGNTGSPISNLKLYDGDNKEYAITEDMYTLVPPQAQLVRFSFTQNEKNQEVSFQTPLQKLDSGTSYKLDLHLDQITEGGTINSVLLTQNITSWMDEGAYFNGEWYPRDHIIATEDELEAFRDYINTNGSSNSYFKGEKYILISDLNFGGRDPWNSGIKTFAGTFLGNGHTISNLFINITTASGLTSYGFISQLNEGGTIDNLHFKNCGISTQMIRSGSAGILIGENWKGTITRCSIENSNIRVYSNGSSANYGAGAIAGINYGAIIACHAKVGIEQQISTGGLIGINQSGTLFGCYYNGKIYGWVDNSPYHIGLLIGYSRHYNNKKAIIRSCYAMTPANERYILLGKPNDYNWNPDSYDKVENLEKNCLLLSTTTDATKADLIKDAADVTDGNGIVWKAEKIWNDDLTINFDYHGEPTN